MSEIAPNERQELARKALEKKAALGPDIDLQHYAAEGEEHQYLEDPSQLPEEDKETVLGSGVILDDLGQRAATFLQKDQSPIHYSSTQEGIEVTSLSEALEVHDWLESYLWQAVEVDTDKFTAQLGVQETDGYLIRSLPGVKTLLPVQACLYLGHKNLAQRVHNVIIAEEDSELHIITGCSSHPMSKGLHLGITEFYVKRGAKVTFTMIHNWSPDIEVRPRSVAIVEEDGVFMSNFVAMKPLRTMQMYPVTRCVGPNATARFNSVLVAQAGSLMDVGCRVVLDGPGSRAEIVSRAISTGGDIIARGDIQGKAPDVKGHLECRGLLLAERGTIRAIPELTGLLAGIELSHEAAVGKIAEEEVEYLMSRGLSRDEATAMIVRGFLKVDIEGLPPMLEAELKKAIEDSEEDLF
jgi:Fe-S cluster assembly scaffold protein SufB